jgi:hypothetical protein
MSPLCEKPTSNDKATPNRSLKKRLAMATVAASLGMSLGVPVGDVLAQDDTALRSRVKGEMEQLEDATKSDKSEVKGEVTEQASKESTQIKLNTGESSQFKWDKGGSTQFKWDKSGSTQFKWDKSGSTQLKLDSEKVQNAE